MKMFLSFYFFFPEAQLIPVSQGWKKKKKTQAIGLSDVSGLSRTKFTGLDPQTFKHSIKILTHGWRYRNAPQVYYDDTAVTSP